MKKLSNVKWLALGVVLCLVVTAFVMPAMAANLTKTAELVYKDIKITLNGGEITPKDANGNVAEPFIIDGTTYLPVRAIGTALGLGVEWDSAKNTVKLSNGLTSPSGTVLLDKEGIKITYLGIVTMKNGGEEIKLCIENTSKTVYTVQAIDTSVNGIMADCSFSSTIAAGKRAYSNMKFSADTLQEIGVTSITTAEMVFNIFEDKDWTKEFYSDIITVNR